MISCQRQQTREIFPLTCSLCVAWNFFLPECPLLIAHHCRKMLIIQQSHVDKFLADLTRIFFVRSAYGLVTLYCYNVHYCFVTYIPVNYLAHLFIL